MKRLFKYIFCMLIMSFGLLNLWNPHTAYAADDEDTITNGVFIDTVDISE